MNPILKVRKIWSVIKWILLNRSLTKFREKKKRSKKKKTYRVERKNNGRTFLSASEMNSFDSDISTLNVFDSEIITSPV